MAMLIKLDLDNKNDLKYIFSKHVYKKNQIWKFQTAYCFYKASLTGVWIMWLFKINITVEVSKLGEKHLGLLQIVILHRNFKLCSKVFQASWIPPECFKFKKFHELLLRRSLPSMYVSWICLLCVLVNNCCLCHP